MAKIIAGKDSITVEDNSSVVDACESLGVPFGCTKGICGTCTTLVLKGEKNLSNLTKKEIDMDLNEGERLMCQCKIKSGEVEIEVF